MKVHGNEMIAPRKATICESYKEDTESRSNSPMATGGSKSPGIPDGDAATATIQHPLREETADIQQYLPPTAAETGVMKKIIAEDLGILEKLKETMEILNSSDPEKKIIVQDLGILKKLKEMMEKLNSSDDGKTIITDDSELLKKLKEIIETINSSEWSLTGIRELIEKFSTTTQFDLQGIQNVEENVKNQNLNLEIGEFSLVRIMEKAREALHGGASTNSNGTESFLGLLKKQEAEGSGGNTNNTPDSGDSENYTLLNTEA